MSEENSRWYFARNDGDREGPVSLDTLRALRNGGQLVAASLVWSPGMRGWQTYQEAFAEGGEQLPPPLPGVDSTAERPGLAEPPEVAAAQESPIRVDGGFWRRVVAYLLDYGVVILGVMVVAIAASASGVSEDAVLGLSLVAVHPIFCLYRAFMHSSERQATLGKMAMGIKVTDLNGKRISFGRASLRVLGQYLSSWTLGIGYVMAAFTEHHQALHDKIASTLVLRKGITANTLALYQTASPMTGGAMAITVVVASIVSLGMVSSFFIPSYEDYLIRAQVSEGLNSASQAKLSIVEAVVHGERVKAIDTASLPKGDLHKSKYVDSIDVIDSVIVLTFGREAHEILAERIVIMVPGFASDGRIVWICGYAAVPEGVEAVLDSHTEYTDVPAKYLPSSCRAS